MPVQATINRAARILAQIGPDQPADAVLRRELATMRRISPAERRDIVRTIFSYFRWQQWLDGKGSAQAQLAEAVKLQDRFDRDPALFKPQALAARAVPAWVHDEVEFSPDDLRALQRDPVLWIRTRTDKAKGVARALRTVRPAPPPADATGMAYEGERDLYRTPEFQDGAFEIQDLGSQLVGHACAAQPGEFWWDACAGEGGKTLHLADQMKNKGLLWATDRSNRRLEKLRERAARAKMFNYRAVNWNGGPYLPTQTLFDGILVDAPCSGLGTWRRNPHARWTTTMIDVQELATLQRQILESLANSLKPGGRLIYAVCTLARSETTAIADAFGAAHPELEPFSLLDRGPQVFLRPGETDANGMFLAGWRRPLEASPASRD